MYGYIYLTTNNINGTIYIGRHKFNKKDKYYYGSGSLILKAITKYGKENFSKIIIDRANTPEELNEKEIFWIDFYKNKLCRKTYNITIGGEGVVGYKVSEETRTKLKQYKGEKNSRYGVTLSEETKNKISQANKGRKFTDEHKQKLSEAKKGTTNWLKGKKMKDVMPEHYDRFRKMAKGRISPNRKKVVVMNKEREVLNRFDSIKECAEYYNAHISCIQRVLSGKRKTYKKMLIEFDN